MHHRVIYMRPVFLNNHSNLPINLKLRHTVHAPFHLLALTSKHHEMWLKCAQEYLNLGSNFRCAKKFISQNSIQIFYALGT